LGAQAAPPRRAEHARHGAAPSGQRAGGEQRALPEPAGQSGCASAPARSAAPICTSWTVSCQSQAAAHSRHEIVGVIDALSGTTRVRNESPWHVGIGRHCLARSACGHCFYCCAARRISATRRASPLSDRRRLRRVHAGGCAICLPCLARSTMSTPRRCCVRASSAIAAWSRPAMPLTSAVRLRCRRASVAQMRFIRDVPSMPSSAAAMSVLQASHGARRRLGGRHDEAPPVRWMPPSSSHRGRAGAARPAAVRKAAE